MRREEIKTLTRQVETPFYHYDLQLLESTIQKAVREASKYHFHIHYAFKANSNDEILQLMKKYNMGADCVSGNEIAKAIANGFESNKVVFAGVGKSDAEIQIALDNNIFCFNCESLPEMEVINELAQKSGVIARVALRINPNVNAKTHHYITTGLEENKFGINLWELDEVLLKLDDLKYITLEGLHFHIGSQITDLNVFKGLCIRVNEIQDYFKNHGISINHLNVGGGLGVDYTSPDNLPIPDFESYFKIFADFLIVSPNQSVHFELGRSLVAQCGNLVTKVLYIKKGIKTNFAIVDAGMTELLRPALYQALHKIDCLSSEKHTSYNYDVVGPICESSDCFGKAILLPELKRNDILVIRSSGAYGEVMSSNYNLRNKAKAYYSMT